jgi:uncharacterized protein (TIGR03067 family)
MSRYAPFLAALLSLGFAPAPFPKPDTTRTDLRKLQGEWTRASYTAGGRENVSARGATIVFAGALLTYSQEGNILGKYTVSLDAKKKPGVFDFKEIESNTNYRGIYKLEGDTLTLCYRSGSAENDRPTDFDPGRPLVIVSVYKRSKR